MFTRHAVSKDLAPDEDCRLLMQPTIGACMMSPLPPGPAHVYPVCVPFTLANTLVLKKINFLPVSISALVTQKLLLNFR